MFATSISAADQAQLEQHKQVIREFFATTHRGELDVIDRLVAADIVTHNFPGGKSPTSREEYKAFFRQWNSGVTEQECVILAIAAEGEHIAVRYAITGRHAGNLFGIPATGNALNFTGVAFYRMTQGQIAETWLYPDTATLLSQLGVLPTAA
ncbi:ester cyclase [Leptolyngbya sp. CCNP1308]|uniref:ester cyclase n=1 Tax=Leptolyngbya sp. CCNP1308 TaxID=3110255 RepID=UPI002B1F641B|nr:ester cyclase [Leptolyngbya sp. CCNP1308]MEA5448650.1 ester cyclase [Leptolyngbya sp. CCNP1308]